MFSKCKKIVYSLTPFGVRYLSKLSSLNCKYELHGFPEDKNSNRTKVLICEFNKKMLKVICKKTKLICELWFMGCLFEPSSTCHLRSQATPCKFWQCDSRN